MRSSAGLHARDAVFAQLPDIGRAELVARRIADGIALGVLAPGDRLPGEAELGRRFGVAVLTVREGLGILRKQELIRTRRGREGGSFVMPPASAAADPTAARLAALSQVELADAAVYGAAILSAAAERAARTCTDADARELSGALDEAAFATTADARVTQSGFLLELALRSQSPRLVREQIRVQAEIGPILLVGLDDAATRAAVRRCDTDVVRAVADHCAAEARDAASAVVACLGDQALARRLRLVAAEAS